jgi:hypothetical protein
MRFGDLAGHSSLPIDFVEQRFRNEDVLTVLPVVREVTPQESLLVATALNLAIVTADADPSSGHWMTRWASWHSVTLDDEGQLASQDDVYALTVHVGGLAFQARLPGAAGRQAIRDFVLAASERVRDPRSVP